MITNFLLGAKSITLYCIKRVWGIKTSTLTKTFILLFFTFYFSIVPKRQSEYSGLRPDASSLVSILLKLNIPPDFLNFLLDHNLTQKFTI